VADLQFERSGTDDESGQTAYSNVLFPDTQRFLGSVLAFPKCLYQGWTPTFRLRSVNRPA
jgi:hypothetical protein